MPRYFHGEFEGEAPDGLTEEEIEAAVLDSLPEWADGWLTEVKGSDYEAGDIVRITTPSGEEGYGFIDSVARDGDLHLKFARYSIRKDDVLELIERTEDPSLSKADVVETIDRRGD